MAASGRDDLGPWGAPTRAGAYPDAPLGLYFLSKERLKQALQSNFETALEFHLAQPKYGPIFCDPNLEVTISSAADVHYEPPGVGRRWQSALGFLLGVRR